MFSKKTRLLKHVTTSINRYEYQPPALPLSEDNIPNPVDRDYIDSKIQSLGGAEQASRMRNRRKSSGL
ncbi:UNVERIFIED_CONTAM: hypothetical protein K2H54_014154 [Gekko kuhli]